MMVACRRLLEEADIRLPQWVPRALSPSGPSLTAREREVASLAASGLSNQGIAARLVVSKRTVENHLQRAYHKLGVTTRSELIGSLDP